MDSCVNLNYPVELHKAHNGYPLTPLKIGKGERMDVRLSEKDGG